MCGMSAAGIASIYNGSGKHIIFVKSIPLFVQVGLRSIVQARTARSLSDSAVVHRYGNDILCGNDIGQAFRPDALLPNLSIQRHQNHLHRPLRGRHFLLPCPGPGRLFAMHSSGFYVDRPARSMYRGRYTILGTGVRAPASHSAAGPAR